MNDVSKKQPAYRTLKKRLKTRERTIQVKLIRQIALAQILVFLLFFSFFFLFFVQRNFPDRLHNNQIKK